MAWRNGEVENWRRRRAEGPVGAAVGARVAVKPVRAAGVRRVGWKREGDLIAVEAMEGRWTIVRRVRIVREEIRGGISVGFCVCWALSSSGFDRRPG